MAPKRKVVVVDDDPFVQEFFQIQLQQMDFDVVTCGNGGQAVDLVVKEKPDLVFLDIMLPDVDGVTVCRRLKSNPEVRHVPILIISALTDEGTVQDVRLYGVKDFIAKPFNTEEIKRKIAQALQPSSPAKS